MYRQTDEVMSALLELVGSLKGVQLFKKGFSKGQLCHPLQFQFNLHTVDTKKLFYSCFRKMPVKSKKEIQTENSELKQKLINVTSNFEKLSQEHKSLKTELIQEREKGKNRCNKCDKISENGKNLKKHMNDRRSTIGLFKCDQCKKCSMRNGN